MLASLLNQLVGNELAQRYAMPKTHAASGGHECLWKVYQATAKGSSNKGEPVSVFVLDKDELRATGMPKNEREQLLDIMRRDIRALKEMDHPRVLKVIEVFEESKRSLAFVAERVSLSLANALHRFKNLSAPVPPEIASFRATEAEVARGICHVAEALQYIHYVKRRLHLGLCPEAVFITPQGVWKLGGLGLSLGLAPNEVGPRASVLCPYYVNPMARKAGGFRLEPSLSYTAPEITAAGTSHASLAADTFSLGCLLYDSFHLPPLGGIADVARPLVDVPDYATPADQHRKIQDSFPWHLPRIEQHPELRNMVERLLSEQPERRPEAASLLSLGFFHSGPVATLRDLDALPTKDPASQGVIVSRLMERLGGELAQPRLLREAVLPPVLQAANASPSLFLHAAPLIIKVCDLLPREEVAATLQWGLQGALALRPPNPQVLFLLGQHLPALLNKTDRSFFFTFVYPALVLLALESNVPQLQDQALKHVATEAIHKAIGNARMLEDVLPRVGKIIVTTPPVSVKVNALVCLTKVHGCFGREVLVDAVLPTLRVCLERDKDPAVVMACVAAFDRVLQAGIDPSYICTHALPVLAPLVYLRTLSAAQFEKVAGRVQAMLSRAVEARAAEVGSSSSSSSGVKASSKPITTTAAPSIGAASSSSSSLLKEDAAASLGDWSWLQPAPPASVLSLDGLEPTTQPPPQQQPQRAGSMSRTPPPPRRPSMDGSSSSVPPSRTRLVRTPSGGGGGGGGSSSPLPVPVSSSPTSLFAGLKTSSPKSSSHTGLDALMMMGTSSGSTSGGSFMPVMKASPPPQQHPGVTSSSSLDTLMVGGGGGSAAAAFMAPIQPVPVHQQQSPALGAIHPMPIGQQQQQPGYDPMSAFDSLGEDDRKGGW